MPARFRERLGTGFFVSIADPDECLLLYPASVWAEFCAKLEAAPLKDDAYRTSVRYLFAHTEEVSCDGQGRVLLPAALRAWAKIEKDVVSIGTLTRVEVWSAAKHSATGAGEAAGKANLGNFRTELGLY